MIRKKNLELSGDLFKNVATRIKREYVRGFIAVILSAILYKVGFLIKYFPAQATIVCIGFLLLLCSIALMSIAILQVIWMFIGLGTKTIYREKVLSERKFNKSFKLNSCSFRSGCAYETVYVPFMGRFVIRRFEKYED